MAIPGSGYLLIADITGYTRFLTASELDHARGILESLFSALLKELKSPFTLSNVQGDAILAHARAEIVSDSQHVLDIVESVYCAFADTLERMIRNTTCTCNACRNIASLDLKLLVHFGRYVEQLIGGRTELSGPDVILIHRLLKNSIPTATGIRAYAAITEAAAAAIHLPAFFDSARSHIEKLDEFGEVTLRVLDMQPVWQKRKSLRTVAVGEEQRAFEDVEIDLPIPPDRAWYYLTDPARRGDWVENVIKTTRMGTDRGRTQIGATEHCEHGDGKTLVFTIVDWRPYESVTYQLGLPMGAYCPFTIFLSATAGGTHVVARIGRAVGPDPIRQTIVRLMMRGMAGNLRAQWVKWFERLSRVAQRDPAARATPRASVDPDTIVRTVLDLRLSG